MGEFKWLKWKHETIEIPDGVQEEEEEESRGWTGKVNAAEGEASSSSWRWSIVKAARMRTAKCVRWMKRTDANGADEKAMSWPMMGKPAAAATKSNRSPERKTDTETHITCVHDEIRPNAKCQSCHCQAYSGRQNRRLHGLIERCMIERRRTMTVATMLTAKCWNITNVISLEWSENVTEDEHCSSLNRKADLEIVKKVTTNKQTLMTIWLQLNSERALIVIKIDLTSINFDHPEQDDQLPICVCFRFIFDFNFDQNQKQNA